MVSYWIPPVPWVVNPSTSNGTLGDVLLFGVFLVWGIFAFVAAQKRDRAAGVVYPVGPVSSDIKTVVAGVVAWFAFGFWLHGPLIGVKPF